MKIESNAANILGTIGNGIVKYGGTKLNAAQKSIVPLSEIANYGAEYEFNSESGSDSEIVELTAQTSTDEFIFVTDPYSTNLIIQFFDKNGRQGVFGGATNVRCFVTVSNTENQLNVFCSAWGGKTFRYNSDGTYKSTFDGTFVQSGTVLTRYNRDVYVPTGDYNPATKKYVDDKISSGDISAEAVAANTAARHTHDNKDVLDCITRGGVNTLEEKWEYINRVSTDVDVGTLMMDVDKDGNSIADLNLKAVAVLIYSPATTNTENTVPGRAIALKKSAVWGRGTMNCNNTPLSARKDEGCYFVTVVRERAGYLMQDVELSSTGNYGNIKHSLGWVVGYSHSPIMFKNSNANDVFELAPSNPKQPIDCVKICGYTSYAAPAGTVMEVYGIKNENM